MSARMLVALVLAWALGYTSDWWVTCARRWPGNPERDRET